MLLTIRFHGLPSVLRAARSAFSPKVSQAQPQTCCRFAVSKPLLYIGKLVLALQEHNDTIDCFVLLLFTDYRPINSELLF